MRDHHLSDRELVLSLDGELPTRRLSAVDGHLRECTACRSRRSELSQDAELATAAYQSSGLDAEGIAASRETLRSKLADLVRQQDDSFFNRIAPGLSLQQTARWVVAGAAVVALAFALVIRVAQQSEVRLADKVVAPVEDDALPVAALTPGATSNITIDDVCAARDREQQRIVSDAISEGTRMEVLRAYRMEHVPQDEYELDYLITPELGGAPEARNLWPQRYRSRIWNAHVKDQLEDLLPRLVCDGEVSLHTAQRDIAADWIAAYKKYFRTEVPLDTRTALAADLRLLEPLAQRAPGVVRPLSFGVTRYIPPGSASSSSHSAPSGPTSTSRMR